MRGDDVRGHVSLLFVSQLEQMVSLDGNSIQSSLIPTHTSHTLDLSENVIWVWNDKKNFYCYKFGWNATFKD